MTTLTREYLVKKYDYYKFEAIEFGGYIRIQQPLNKMLAEFENHINRDIWFDLTDKTLEIETFDSADAFADLIIDTILDTITTAAATQIVSKTKEKLWLIQQ